METDLDQMPRLSQRINFVGNGNEADRLRGMEYFRTQQTLVPEVARVGVSLALERDRCGLYIVLMPAMDGIAERLERVAKLKCGCRSIVDVHADFWATTPNPNLPTVTPPEVWSWWRDGDHVAVLERSMRAADVITVPSVHYVASVEQFNPNIVIVPDVSDDEDDVDNQMAVVRGWLDAMMIARQHKN